ncbi:MAG: radical SAM family heme chaperone HemW [Ruminococcus sp.]
MDKNIGLYIHIPFCAKKCNYCDFYSLKANDGMYDVYTGILNRSIDRWAEKFIGRSVDTVYFGGGTPSLLGTDRISKILYKVEGCFNVTANAEITIEVNPATTGGVDFSVLKGNGVNRVSVGMQSKNEDELKILGRIHRNADVDFTVDRILRSGIDDFSLDIMLGIPLQTERTLKNTLEYATESGATHLSTYMLKIEPGTNFYNNAENIDFADEDTQADMYEFTSKYLSDKGFRHYEISNFCRGDRVSRHNMKYWELKDYLGLGPSAHSMIGNSRFYYPSNIKDFAEDKILFESEGNTPDEYIMLSLRTDSGFSLEKYKELFSSVPSADIFTEAKKLEKLGLTRVAGDNISLTEKGFLLSNAVISQLQLKY